MLLYRNTRSSEVAAVGRESEHRKARAARRETPHTAVRVSKWTRDSFCKLRGAVKRARGTVFCCCCVPGWSLIFLELTDNNSGFLFSGFHKVLSLLFRDQAYMTYMNITEADNQ